VAAENITSATGRVHRCGVAKHMRGPADLSRPKSASFNPSYHR